MHQTAGEARSPPDRCSNEFLGVSAQIFSTLAQGKCEQVPAGAHAAGRCVFDVPWHCGEAHGDEATCYFCSQSLLALAEGPASGAVQGLRITEIAAQMQGGGGGSIAIPLWRTR